jgi:hypothetical protein
MLIRHIPRAIALGALLLTGCGGGGTEGAGAKDATPLAMENGHVGPGAAESIEALPSPTHSVAGRVVTVTLPYRAADGQVWVSATKMSEAAPFVFRGIEIKPGSGPNGTDLALFKYEAERAGSATLKFGLVPAGKMLVGLPSLVYTGPVRARYDATVSAL